MTANKEEVFSNSFFSNSLCNIHPGVIVHTRNLSSWKVESERLPWVQGHLGLCGKLKAIWTGVRLCLIKPKEKVQLSQGYLTSICHLCCPLNCRKLEWEKFKWAQTWKYLSLSNSPSLTHFDLLVPMGKEVCFDISVYSENLAGRSSLKSQSFWFTGIRSSIPFRKPRSYSW